MSQRLTYEKLLPLGTDDKKLHKSALLMYGWYICTAENHSGFSPVDTGSLEIFDI